MSECDYQIYIRSPYEQLVALMANQEATLAAGMQEHRERRDSVSDRVIFFESLIQWVQEPEKLEDQVARRMAVVMTMGLIPCPPLRHESQVGILGCIMNEHGNCTASEHVSLEEASGNPPHFLGLYRNWGASLQGRQYQRENLPPADTIGRLMEGEPGHRVCLQKNNDQHNVVYKPILFDLDSFIFVSEARDIGNQLRGSFDLAWYPTPHMHLQKSLHVDYPVPSFNDRGTPVIIRVPVTKIPLIFMGSTNAGDSIYIGFPGLYHINQIRAANHKSLIIDLRHRDYEILYNHIIEPAIRAVILRDADHEPNWTTLMDKAHAKAREHNSETYRSSHYRIHLPEGGLGAIGEAFASISPTQTLIATAQDRKSELGEEISLSNFADPFFLVDTYNLKQKYTGHSISESQAKWKADNDQRPEEDESLRLDHAVEWAAQQHTLLARSCCQRRTLLFLYGNVREALTDRSDDPQLINKAILGGTIKGGKHTEYPVHLLHGCHSVTTEPAKKSELRKAGIDYMQFYTRSKAVFDAAGIYPWSHNYLPLCLRHDDDYQPIAKMAGLSANRGPALKADQWGRERAFNALRAKWELPYAWRFEVRASAILYPVIEDQIQQFRCWLPQHFLEPCESALEGFDSRLRRATRRLGFSDAFIATHPTDYNKFRFDFLQKMTQTMDYVYATYHYTKATPVAADLLWASLALLLRHFISALPAKRYNNFLYSLMEPREENGEPGLQLKVTMQNNGFGGCLPRGLVNWETFTIKDRYLNIRPPLFRNIRGYIAASAQRSKDTSFDRLLNMLQYCVKMNRDSGGLTDPASTWMRKAHGCKLLLIFVVQAYYRFEMLGALCKHCSSTEINSQIAQDAYEFSWVGLQKLNGNGVGFWYASGRKDVQPEPVFRRIWQTLPYIKAPGNPPKGRIWRFRLWYQNAYHAIQESLGPTEAEGWAANFEEHFWQAHSCIPVLDSKGSLTKSNANDHKHDYKVLCVETFKMGSHKKPALIGQCWSSQVTVHRIGWSFTTYQKFVDMID